MIGSGIFIVSADMARILGSPFLLLAAWFLTAVMTMLGGIGASLMAIAILISTFGCNNGLILAGARVYWAMAKDGLFFRPAARLNRAGVPAWALLFYALTTTGLFVLRVRKPEVPRPYRAVGYPFLPALYVVMAATVAVILLMADKTRPQALSGLAVVLLGVPVYFLTRHTVVKVAS